MTKQVDGNNGNDPNRDDLSGHVTRKITSKGSLITTSPPSVPGWGFEKNIKPATRGWP